MVRQLNFYSEGRRLVSLEFARCGSRFGFLLDLPQDQTERLLRARITELGGVVEDQTELIGLTAGREAVTAIVRDRGGSGVPDQLITAGYVVGCDGAHSRVRRELGLTFHGHPYPQDWLLADVRAGLGPAGGRGARVLPARRAAGDLLPDARAPVAADAAVRREPEPADSHPGGDPGADRPAGAAAGYRVRSHLAGQLPLPSPVGQRLPARSRASWPGTQCTSTARPAARA